MCVCMCVCVQLCMYMYRYVCTCVYMCLCWVRVLVRSFVFGFRLLRPPPPPPPPSHSFHLPLCEQRSKATEFALQGNHEAALAYTRSACAFQDTPWCLPAYHRLLAERYPKASFVLTHRQSSAVWWKSLRHWVDCRQTHRYEEHILRALGLPSNVTSLEEQSAVGAYHTHNRAVVAYFARENGHTGRFSGANLTTSAQAGSRTAAPSHTLSVWGQKRARLASRVHHLSQSSNMEHLWWEEARSVLQGSRLLLVDFAEESRNAARFWKRVCAHLRVSPERCPQHVGVPVRNRGSSAANCHAL
jgi:Sulfotransferase domain